jgi:hypothetical protein
VSGNDGTARPRIFPCVGHRNGIVDGKKLASRPSDFWSTPHFVLSARSRHSTPLHSIRADPEPACEEAHVHER